MMDSIQETLSMMKSRSDAMADASVVSKPAAKKARRKKTAAKKPSKAGAMAKRVKTPLKAAKKRSAKAKSTGTRYSPEFKANVIAWLQENPERGNVSKALKKFGISYISLRGWLKKSGISKPGKKGKAVKSSGRVGRPKSATSKLSSEASAVFGKRAKKKIMEGLGRMAHGIETLLEGFGHIT